jgi:hypothetical protein
MKNRTIVPLSYAVTVGTICLAMYAKATNSVDLVTMFIIVLVSQFIFAAFAIYELSNSEHFTAKEKSNWTALLLCAPLLLGIIYFSTIRKRIRFV